MVEKISDCHSEAFKIICLVKYSGLAQSVERTAVSDTCGSDIQEEEYRQFNPDI